MERDGVAGEDEDETDDAQDTNSVEADEDVCWLNVICHINGNTMLANSQARGGSMDYKEVR